MNNNLILLSIFFVSAIFTSENPERSPESNNKSSNSNGTSTPRGVIEAFLKSGQFESTQSQPLLGVKSAERYKALRKKVDQIRISSPVDKFNEMKSTFLKNHDILKKYLRGLNSELIFKPELWKELKTFFRDAVSQKNVKVVSILIQHRVVDESVFEECIHSGIKNEDYDLLEIARIINPSETAERLILKMLHTGE